MAIATGLAVEAESAGVAVPAVTPGKGKDHGDFVFPSKGLMFLQEIDSLNQITQPSLVHYSSI